MESRRLWKRRRRGKPQRSAWTGSSGPIRSPPHTTEKMEGTSWERKKKDSDPSTNFLQLGPLAKIFNTLRFFRSFLKKKIDVWDMVFCVSLHSESLCFDTSSDLDACFAGNAASASHWPYGLFVKNRLLLFQNFLHKLGQGWRVRWNLLWRCNLYSQDYVLVTFYLNEKYKQISDLSRTY